MSLSGMRAPIALAVVALLSCEIWAEPAAPPLVPQELESAQIGVALSGGGSRAAAWALGGLLAIADAGHQRSIVSIASVSGGSVTNAYFAQQQPSFDSMTAETVERSAAGLAATLAGSPRAWTTGLAGLMAALFVSWCGAWRRPRARRRWCPMAISVCGIVWGILFGTAGGGVLWTWWGTWAYLGGLGLMTTVAIQTWRGGASRSVRLALCLFLGGAVVALLAQRHVVAEFAIDDALASAIARSGLNPMREPARGKALAEINPSPLHVFCATEMHTGAHAFFARGFVYSLGFGVGQPGNLRVRTAVQASANFPGGFPPRLMRADRFGFAFGPYKDAKWMVLSDGGVYDNMGTAWYAEVLQRRNQLLGSLGPGQRLGLDEDVADPLIGDPWVTESWQRQWDSNRRRDRKVLVFNAAPAFSWTDRPYAWVPGFADIFGLRDVTMTMYNNILHSRYHLARYDSTIVDYANESPEMLLLDIESLPSDDAEAWTMHDGFGWTARPLLQYLASGDPNMSPVLKARSDVRSRWEAMRTRNSNIGTHFNPLGRRQTAELMFHAYVLTIAQLHLFYNSPLIEPLPTMARFEALAGGRPHDEPVSRWRIRQGARYTLE